MASKTQNPVVHPSLFRKVVQIMFGFLGGFLALILVLTAILLAFSPGKPVPLLDENKSPLVNSISEKTFITINGVRQGMFIQGKNIDNPVLLYLHGGMPDYFLTQKYPTGLENYFTVVWWEQRGSGISYDAKIAAEPITLDQMIADTLEMTRYLRQRFGKEKIYLMGHSGGTFIGIQTAARAPELFHAYIGVAQMANQRESEQQAYDFMLQAYKTNGNKSMVRKLEASPVIRTGEIAHSYLLIRDQAMHGLGIGTTRDMNSVVTGILLPSLFFPQYTLSEKFNLWAGKSRSGVSSMWDEIVTTDLAKHTPELNLPVYFIEGRYDYTCSYTVAKSYFETLKAPLKGFYTFENSAHSPLFEEPEKLQRILVEDVLQGKNSLADAP